MPHSDHLALILLLCFWTLGLAVVVNNRIVRYRRERRERKQAMARRINEVVKGSK